MPWFGYLILIAMLALLVGVILWPLERLRDADDVMLQPPGDQPRTPGELI